MNYEGSIDNNDEQDGQIRRIELADGKIELEQRQEIKAIRASLALQLAKYRSEDRERQELGDQDGQEIRLSEGEGEGCPEGKEIVQLPMSGIAVFKSDQEGFIEQTEPQLQQLVSEYDLDVCNESFEIDQSGTVQEDEEGKVAQKEAEGCRSTGLQQTSIHLKTNVIVNTSQRNMAIDNEQKILSYQKYNNLNRMIDGVEKSVLDGAEKNMEDKLYYSSYIPYPYLHEPEKCLRQTKIENLLEIDQSEGTNRIGKAQSGEEVKICEGRQPCREEQSEDSQQEELGGQIGSIRVKIVGYSCKYFMKIETQVYKVQVCMGMGTGTNTSNSTYTIHRRYSDFLLLHNVLRAIYPGTLLAPFPDKDAQTFLKIKLAYSDKAQKYSLIQKRLGALQQYLQSIIAHSQLSKCTELKTFLLANQAEYAAGVTRLQTSVDRLQTIDNNTKGIVWRGYNYLRSFVTKDNGIDEDTSVALKIIKCRNRQRSLPYVSYIAKLEIFISRTQKQIGRLNELVNVKRRHSQFHDINTDVDQLLQLSAKITSSKCFSKQLLNWVDFAMVDHLRQVLGKLKSIRKVLKQQEELVEVLEQGDQLHSCERVEQRIELFNSNFEPGWRQYEEEYQMDHLRCFKEFQGQWYKHAQQMRKVWK